MLKSKTCFQDISSHYLNILIITTKTSNLKFMNITIVGMGYVGLSLGILLAQKNNVILLDISKIKVDLINIKRSPIKDKS